ncbi:MAG: NUDIX hydrolase [Chloroflexi bacterium]|jgi:8-oxo-dGTP pyrophosphatase MutT (NUDIX family)|nr:NUDIX hydrolase [Chloroflexota bacterium]
MHHLQGACRFKGSLPAKGYQLANFKTTTQTSAGGVVFRQGQGQLEIALISVGEDGRWQLPKGLIGAQEAPEAAALREVREETGLHAENLGLIDEIEYWFFTRAQGERVRVHKRVLFYLMRFLSGSTDNHDWEVNEARWVEIDAAVQMLAFESEKKVVTRARELILAGPADPEETSRG